MGMDAGMMDIDSVEMNGLAAEASTIASYPGALSSASVRDFLSRYPFPILFSALSRQSGNAEFVTHLVQTLEKIVQSPDASSVLSGVLPYVNLGLAADSPPIRRLACEATGRFLETGDASSPQAVAGHEIVGPLLNVLRDKDSGVAKAAADTLLNLAKSPAGIDLVFGGDRLKALAMDSSALIRVRTLSLAAQIFGLSEVAAAAVQSSGILQVLERELGDTNDTLAQINAVEILCELADTPFGSNLLLAGNFVRQLIFLIGNSQVDPMIRSRSMLAGSRLISAVSEADGYQIIQAIVSCLERIEELENKSENWDKTEKEAAIEAIGQIGLSAYGAEAVLSGPGAPAHYVVHSALKGHGDILHLTALHALALISGSEREEVRVHTEPEKALRRMLFDATQSSSLSNKLLQLLREPQEVRQAVYRLIVPLASRSWFVFEVCSSSTLIDFVVDPSTESSKSVMEWRHACCAALSTGLTSIAQDGWEVPLETLEKLDAADKRGPYLSKRRVEEAVPAVATEERY